MKFLLRVAIAALLCISTAWGQNPLTAKYPSAIITDQDFPLAANRAYSTLTSTINSSVTTITVANASAFRYPTIVTIDTESILICSIAGNVMTVCTGGRGLLSTAASHTAGAVVFASADQYFSLRAQAEIKAIQTALGTNPVLTLDDLSDNILTDLSDVSAKSGVGTIVMTGVGAFVPGNCLETDANGDVVDAGAACGTGGGGGAIDIEELDGAPSVTSAGTLQFHQGDGFTVTDSGGGVALVRLPSYAYANLSGVPSSFAPSTHAASHAENAADEIMAESLGTACSAGLVLESNGSGGVSCGLDNGALVLPDLTDVTISGAALGQFLRYNSIAWVNTTIKDGDVPDNITIDLATAATALAANGANCTAGQAAGGVDASGAAESCIDPVVSTEIDTFAELDALVADQTLVHSGSNIATATALAANPTDCAAGEYANAIDASGNLTCAAVSGGASDLDALTDVTITTATTDDVLKYNGSAWVNTNLLSAIANSSGSVIIPDGSPANPGAVFLSDQNTGWLYGGTSGIWNFVADGSNIARLGNFNTLQGLAIRTAPSDSKDNFQVRDGVSGIGRGGLRVKTDGYWRFYSGSVLTNRADFFGNITFHDNTATTGVTSIVLKAGAGQSTTDLMQWQDNAGAVLARIRSDGDLASPNVLTEDTDDRTTGFIGTDTAEGSTTTTNLNMTAHGLSTGQLICNTTRSACSLVTVVDADNVTTSTITGQASGDSIRTYDYPNRRSSWQHETTPIDDIFLDNIPLGAVQMTWNAAPTRNFDSLIYLDLPDGAAIDKGRGLFVWNHGYSDAINVLADNGGVAAAFICADNATPTNNSFCEAHEVRSATSIGSYVRSTATAGGPHLMFLDQQSTAASKPTAMIDITGNAAHTAFNVKNTGGNSGVIYYQALDSEGDVRFQMSGNGIELGDTGDDSASTTFDFHSGSATADYDVRLLSTGGAGTAGAGTLTVYAATVDMSGLVLKADELDLDDAGTKPTCDASQRGKIWYDEGDPGVADTAEICGKDASDVYAWTAIATF